MSSLVILAIGLSIVVGGILFLRLHAFIALVLAGFTVSLLTAPTAVHRAAEMEVAVKAQLINHSKQTAVFRRQFPKNATVKICKDGDPGMPLVIVGTLAAEATKSGSDADDGALYEYGFNAAETDDTEQWLFVRESAIASGKATAAQTSMQRLTAALGSYCGSLAILIVAAAIIGKCLLESGAADTIVRRAIEYVGVKNAPAAFVASGFTLSIPVFFDTVFYLMVPLGQALRKQTGRNYLLYVLAIVAGGTMAHSLVPPTPGPLFIMEAFQVDILAMVVGGCIVGLFSSSVAMIYAYWINRKHVLELPEATPIVADESPAETTTAATESASPGFVVSLIPVLLPVLLIAAGSLSKALGLKAGNLSAALQFVGDKNVALLVSAIFAVAVLVRTKRPNREQLANILQSAVTSAGPIILVTAAGGAFGRMMRQTGVSELLQSINGSSPVMIVVAAFLVTVAVRTAQGSSTVAMMTAAGIFGGLVANGNAGVAPIYVALAVGCGSKPFAWMNDSGFWVITRMSGMTEQQGLKFITPMTAIAGFAGLGAVIVGVLVFP